RQALAEAGHQATSAGGEAALAGFRPGAFAAPAGQRGEGGFRPETYRPVPARPVAMPLGWQASLSVEPDSAARLEGFDEPGVRQMREEEDVVLADPADHPLGVARGQLHETYVLAENAEGLVIVDQHAAHERLVYERLKAGRAAGGVAAQGLLLPEVVTLAPDDVERLGAACESLSAFGLELEAFGASAVLVRTVPALLGTCDVKALVTDIADELAENTEATALEVRLNAIASRMACHGSIRAGRLMR
ncbi:MAG: DNA mismatch repair protein MutL, partial [Hyphomicrobiaceae bacterium]|nr:DNA mismatch repair protein MutL [Hyphomicrobiaceae bacterium]